MSRHRIQQMPPARPRRSPDVTPAPPSKSRTVIRPRIATLGIGGALAVTLMWGQAPSAAHLGGFSTGAESAERYQPSDSSTAGLAGRDDVGFSPSASSREAWAGAERRASRNARAEAEPPTTADPDVADSTATAGQDLVETSSSDATAADRDGAPATDGTDPSAIPVETASGLLGGGVGVAGGVLANASALGTLPTSGTAWNNLLSAARDHSGSVALADQNSTHAARTLASALVAVRTGDAAQRQHVVSVLRQLEGASLSGSRVLSVSRQLAGYVLAADVIGHREPGFVSWVGSMRTKDIGGHGRWTTITGTSEDSANNWGTWAMATRIAISSYVGDSADLQRAATVFRGFTGERSSYAGFRKTGDFDPSWACGGESWVPINPASCGAKGGAIVEDISRSAGSFPSVDSTGLTYSWEVLGGATLSARLLERAGHGDVWQWGDRALLRAAAFLHGHGGYAPEYRVNQYIPHEINAAYGVNLGPVGPAGFGRQFGFSDWLR